MNKNYIEEYPEDELLEIENLACDICCLIEVVIDSCESHCYTAQEIALRRAKQGQYELIERISNLRI